ncbi:ImmA/IrrE family metallo-endopeptidase [Pseudomonas umsongensis]|uniref:ImmA/IrrE family metallo-endopeptidase n=1 Tax=Pseudomonas umsongensis TaxID=198618 RepID=A0AAE7A0J0_9PSED|nr:ImmA/IrrE family metallo-endopeptidase [Pseudomonas umsongensis]QJC81546.1 ImmA/IrrE family metallo-endopeptidase [Pseudomonas umsongensis]
MSDEQVWTPQKAANRLSKISEAFGKAHGGGRFPVDVPLLALEAANIFGWSDPITEVKPVDIKSFDGALFPDGERKKWMLLFNSAMSSPGRIRFTQAHELGHYILHRQMREAFQCSNDDMLDWEEKTIEAQADLFSSYLLMPLDDFRAQVTTLVDLEMLGHCADRYGVSLTAAVLKWIQYTEENAVLVLSRDGYMQWSFSSRQAARAGAFFRTRKQTVAVPAGSIAVAPGVKHERRGIEVPAKVWFPHADAGMSVREMKVSSDQFDYVLSLLYLPRSASVWRPSETERHSW